MGSLVGCGEESSPPPTDASAQAVEQWADQVKLKFDPASFEIERAYDQRGAILLSNDGNTTVDARVLAMPPDLLPAGFVGRGSNDWYEFSTITMKPGETWKFPFIMHAQVAPAGDYTVPIKAVAKAPDGQFVTVTEAKVPVRVLPASFKLKTQWIESKEPTSQSQLAKVLRITNEGDGVPDLTLSTPAAQEINPNNPPALTGNGKLIANPVIQHTNLDQQQSIEVVIRPVITPGFTKTEGKLVLSGNGATIEVDYNFEVPQGKQVYTVLTRSTSSSSNSGKRCTNRSSAGYSLPPTPGTPAPSGGSGGSGGGGGGGGGALAGEPEDEDESDEVWGFVGLGEVVSANDQDENQAEGADGDEPATSTEELVDKAENDIAETTLTTIDDSEGTLPPEATGSEEMTVEEAIREAIRRNGGRPLNLDEVEYIARPYLDAAGLSGEDFNAMTLAPELSDPMQTVQLPPSLRDLMLPADPTSNTVSKTVYRDGDAAGVGIVRRNSENNSGFEFHDFGFGIAGPGRRIGGGGGGGGGGGRVIRQPQAGSGATAPAPAVPSRRVPITDGSFPVSDPTIARGPKGDPIAAYSRPTKQNGKVVEVKDIRSGKVARIGDGKSKVDQPQIVPVDDGSDSVDVVYREDNTIRRVRLNQDMSMSEADILRQAEQDKPAPKLLRARKNPKGELTILTAEPERLILSDSKSEQAIAGTAGDFDFNEKGQTVVVARTTEGAIDIHQPTADGKTKVARIIEPTNKPLQTPGRPALMKTPEGKLRMFYHVPLAPGTRELPTTPGINPAAQASTESTDKIELTPGVVVPGIAGGQRRIAPVETVGGTFAVDLYESTTSNRPKPRRVPQPEQPVTNAALAIEIQPSFASGTNKKTNTTVLINGQTIAKLDDRATSGRYLFQLPPEVLNYAPFGDPTSKPNRVELKVQGIGGGNLVLTDQCTLYTKHDMIQQSIVADSQQAAEKIAAENGGGINHNRPDLVLTNNAWDPPRDTPAGETVTAIVGLFNTGDVPAPAGKIIAYFRDQPIGSINHPAVAPFEKKTVALNFTMPPYDAENGTNILLHAPVADDADPRTNFLSLRMAPERMDDTAGPTQPIGVNIANLDPDTVQDIDPNNEPVKRRLSTGSMWFKFPVNDNGILAVDFENLPEMWLLGVDLFSPQGELLNPTDERWQIEQDTVYLRVGVQPGVNLAEDATVTIAWETSK